jgi:hypothetical protein
MAPQAPVRWSCLLLAVCCLLSARCLLFAGRCVSYRPSGAQAEEEACCGDWQPWRQSSRCSNEFCLLSAVWRLLSAVCSALSCVWRQTALCCLIEEVSCGDWRTKRQLGCGSPCFLPFAVCCLLAAVCCLLSAVRRLLIAVGRLLSIVCCLSSAACSI